MKIKSIIAITLSTFTLMACTQDKPSEAAEQLKQGLEQVQAEEAASNPIPDGNQQPVVQDNGIVMIQSQEQKLTEWKLGKDEHGHKFNVLESDDGAANLLVGCGTMVFNHNGGSYRWVLKMFKDESNPEGIYISTSAVNYNGKTYPINQLQVVNSEDERFTGFPVWTWTATQFQDPAYNITYEVINENTQNGFLYFNKKQMKTTVNGQTFIFTMPPTMPKCVPGDGRNEDKWIVDN